MFASQVLLDPLSTIPFCRSVVFQHGIEPHVCRLASWPQEKPSNLPHLSLDMVVPPQQPWFGGFTLTTLVHVLCQNARFLFLQGLAARGSREPWFTDFCLVDHI